MGIETSLIEYPCAFPIKVMGKNQAGFAQAMMQILMRQAPDFDPASMEIKSSKKGKYLSLTCIIQATSRNQLDELYRELCDHPTVVMVL